MFKVVPKFPNGSETEIELLVGRHDEFEIASVKMSVAGVTVELFADELANLIASLEMINTQMLPIMNGEEE